MMKDECPQCGYRFTADARDWAYARFRREVCPECGWRGERFNFRPIPGTTDLANLKFKARKIL